MKDVREILKKRPLLFDGGMGTYYKAKPGQECEQANLLDPDGILTVHRAYLEAGADAIKTNTFGLPRMAAAQNPMWEAMADEGWKLAAQAAAKTSAAVFADLGPATDTEALPAAQIYTALAERFAALGAKNFLFETLSSDAGVAEAARQIKEAVPDAFVLVSFAVLPDGYTGLPGGHTHPGAVSGQAGIFCTGAGPPCCRGCAYSGRLLRHYACPHCGPACGTGCLAGNTACSPGSSSLHCHKAGGGKRRCLPAQAERGQKGDRH